MKHRIITLLAVAVAIAAVFAASWGTLIPIAKASPVGDGGPVAACNDLRIFWQMVGTNGLTYVCTFGYPDYWAWTGH